jgi:hypothetical protein
LALSTDERRVLDYIGEARRAVTLYELSDKLGIGTRALRRILDRLVSLKYLAMEEIAPVGLRERLTALTRGRNVIYYAYWRLQKAWLWYPRGKKKGKTPEPFSEVRVYVYTQHPEEYEESMFDSLYSALVVSLTLSTAEGMDRAYDRELGFEIARVGYDEVLEEALDVFFAYVVFYSPELVIEHEYKFRFEAGMGLKWFEEGEWVEI